MWQLVSIDSIRPREDGSIEVMFTIKNERGEEDHPRMGLSANSDAGRIAVAIQEYIDTLNEPIPDDPEEIPSEQLDQLQEFITNAESSLAEMRAYIDQIRETIR